MKSSSFKDVYLPVASISEERKNDKILYKITAKVEKLQQEIESRYKDNFTFYLAKKGTEETTNFTSFSNLVKAINQNLAGTYHLAASLNANEVELANTDNAYIKGTFTGKLIGKNNGKHYAIYNLKKSLFDSLSNATVENLSLKSVNISGKNDIGSLANEAKNGTTINEVHVDGLLGGERGIGGLVAKVDQSNITNSSFTGRIVNTYETKSAYNPEFFAKGLLQAPDQPSDATITINSILKHKTSDSTEGQRLQVLDPTTRFNDAADLQNYVHNMFDVVYMLEYLEGQSIVKQLDAYQKMTALRKIENKYVKDPADGNEVYATNVVKELTEEEARNLNSFDSLIDNNILSAREYKAGTYERNGYFTIKLFAPIFSALSSEKGTPGDLMGRRMAYELLAAKGFKDGMVPYISNQFEADARANNKTITSYGKTKGLVTDTLVLQKLFNGQYNTWSDFKKAMYKERQDKFNKLNKISFKDPSQPWTRNIIKTIHSVNELQNLMNEAVRKDTETPHWYNYNPEIDSAVHKLKRAIFKAYLDQTNDFRSSIFENKK